MADNKNAGRKVPINRIPLAGPIGGGKAKVEMKHVAIVTSIKCGSWYSRHYHYNVSVVEVGKDTSVEKIRLAAEKANEIISQFTGKKISVLTVENVEIGSQERMKEIGAKFLESIKL